MMALLLRLRSGVIKINAAAVVRRAVMRRPVSWGKAIGGSRSAQLPDDPVEQRSGWMAALAGELAIKKAPCGAVEGSKLAIKAQTRALMA